MVTGSFRIGEGGEKEYRIGGRLIRANSLMEAMQKANRYVTRTQDIGDEARMQYVPQEFQSVAAGLGEATAPRDMNVMREAEQAEEEETLRQRYQTTGPLAPMELAGAGPKVPEGAEAWMYDPRIKEPGEFANTYGMDVADLARRSGVSEGVARKVVNDTLPNLRNLASVDEPDAYDNPDIYPQNLPRGFGRRSYDTWNLGSGDIWRNPSAMNMFRYKSEGWVDRSDPTGARNKRPEDMYRGITEDEKKVYRTLHTGSPEQTGPYWTGSESVEPPYPDSPHVELPSGKWGTAPEAPPAEQIGDRSRSRGVIDFLYNMGLFGQEEYSRLTGELGPDVRQVSNISDPNRLRGDYAAVPTISERRPGESERAYERRLEMEDMFQQGAVDRGETDPFRQMPLGTAPPVLPGRESFDFNWDTDTFGAPRSPDVFYADPGEREDRIPGGGVGPIMSTGVPSSEVGPVGGPQQVVPYGMQDYPAGREVVDPIIKSLSGVRGRIDAPTVPPGQMPGIGDIGGQQTLENFFGNEPGAESLVRNVAFNQFLGDRYPQGSTGVGQGFYRGLQNPLEADYSLSALLGKSGSGIEDYYANLTEMPRSSEWNPRLREAASILSQSDWSGLNDAQVSMAEGLSKAKGQREQFDIAITPQMRGLPASLRDDFYSAALREFYNILGEHGRPPTGVPEWSESGDWEEPEQLALGEVNPNTGERAFQFLPWYVNQGFDLWGGGGQGGQGGDMYRQGFSYGE